ncbi:peptide-methionine (S)-S-oxide reductase MsrA [Mesohalobacter halotolerans]|uniref:Peptide methionine sulfoxide reductase MsrA n=1 Tax=Mesohalobacter halotolerans TaxID=1883405 RepID=A0A4V6AL92_9FLAO|nr:peptide-methionine (S)-S-oxide reductase MsrA [Mesohalobacter halotolerans]MBS3738166.1 peptide-methionine (S)-S-oxide reductase MsrA [Psychroflexus sp.]TKS55615.1 peptide-methionine (S)-S-oxide reductase MsrA [Mesohalobacter halotolerans]
MSEAIFANGCFWCTQAVFQRLKGVESVRSGFTGGTIKNPAYREVVMGNTGHAEAIHIVYDENVIDYDILLYVFFSTHDPTTLNRQGYDVGTQYRSAIFYKNDSQKQTAERVIKTLNAEVFDDKIVTQLQPATAFYEATKEHQDFYNKNTEYRYCQLVIEPKLKTLKDKFSPYLKS